MTTLEATDARTGDTPGDGLAVEIEYCVPCGHLDAALEAQRALLTEFGRQLHSVTLRTSHGGVFKVRAGGDLLFDKSEDGYDVDAIVDAVGARL